MFLFAAWFRCRFRFSFIPTEKPRVTNANYHGANLSALSRTLHTVTSSLSFISSELSSGLPDIHRSFISFMTDARDQAIWALRGLFKDLIQTHPSESPPPLPLSLSPCPSLFPSPFSRIFACLGTHGMSIQPNRVVRNFVPAIGVAYSPCECRWEFDVPLCRDISLDMPRASPFPADRCSCRPFSTTRNRVLTRDVISYVPSAPMPPETRWASTMGTFRRRLLLYAEMRRYLVNDHRRTLAIKDWKHGKYTRKKRFSLGYLKLS